MKILHLMDTGGLYGKERMVLALIKKQVEEGHTVYTMGFGNDAYYDEASKICHYTYHLNAIKQLWGVLRDGRYDVIHTHDYKTGIISATWKAVQTKANKRTVIRTLHGYTSNYKFSKLWFYEKLDGFMTRFNSRTIAVSDEMGKELNVPVVYNGIEEVDPKNINHVKPRANIYEFCNSGINMHEDAFVLCCMARLSPEKNLKMLIDAVFALDKVKLLLFGDGPLRKELEEMTKWNPDKVFFAGFDKHAPLYLQYVDGYIQPSLTEGLPISVLEALSQETPLLLTSIGGMKDLLRAGVASECRKGTVGLMASSILQFMIQDRIRESDATYGKELFEKHFSADAMYREYQKHYMALTMTTEAQQCVE